MKPIVIIAIIIVGSIIAIVASPIIIPLENQAVIVKKNPLESNENILETNTEEVQLEFHLPDDYLETSTGLEKVPEGVVMERIPSDEEIEYSKMTVLEMNQIYLNCISEHRTGDSDAGGLLTMTCRSDAMDMARAYCGDVAYDCGFYICPCVDEVVDVIYDELLKARSEQSIEVIYDKLEKARSGNN